MARFLIEVPHESDIRDCTRAVEIFLRTGSHFLTHADWGCRDKEHKAWLIVDVDTREEARNIVPAEFRAQAHIVKLNGFTWDDIDPKGKRRPAAASEGDAASAGAT